MVGDILIIAKINYSLELAMCVTYVNLVAIVLRVK